MHHGDAILRMSQRLVVQPFNQLLTVGCVEDVLEIIFPAGARAPQETAIKCRS